MATRLPIVLLFVLVTFCCWGTYGPVLHIGQEAMGSGRLRPFIGVGIAYFIVAVIIPLIVGPRIAEPGRWTLRGILWSLLAGTIGALGSLGVIFAFNAGGKPVFVMPLVFGLAPVVNTLVTMLTSRSTMRPGMIFYLGIALVAFGAAGVLKFKPTPAGAVAHPSQEHAAQQAVTNATESESAGDDLSTETSEDNGTVASETLPSSQQSWAAWFATVISIMLTAICWGSYGPALHKGQACMFGSRLRPFICVGIAYFVVAILIPAGILLQSPEQGSWTIPGILWSLGAGGLGAIGALGVIMAFTFGGKPSYVMPLVFGGAPIVNTITSMTQSWFRSGTVGEAEPAFFISLAMVVTGAVLVLLRAPKAHPPQPSAERPNEPEATNGTEPSSPTAKSVGESTHGQGDEVAAGEAGTSTDSGTRPN